MQHAAFQQLKMMTADQTRSGSFNETRTDNVAAPDDALTTSSNQVQLCGNRGCQDHTTRVFRDDLCKYGHKFNV